MKRQPMCGSDLLLADPPCLLQNEHPGPPKEDESNSLTTPSMLACIQFLCKSEHIAFLSMLGVCVVLSVTACQWLVCCASRRIVFAAARTTRQYASLIQYSKQKRSCKNASVHLSARNMMTLHAHTSGCVLAAHAWVPQCPSA